MTIAAKRRGEIISKLLDHCGAVNTDANLRTLIGYVKFSSPAFLKVDHINDVTHFDAELHGKGSSLYVGKIFGSTSQSIIFCSRMQNFISINYTLTKL